MNNRSEYSPSSISSMTVGRCRLLRLLRGLAGALWALTGLGAAEPAPPADDWLANPVVFPRFADPAQILTNDFLALHSECLAGRLKIRWETSPINTNWTVVVQASADVPGHWLARDWRPYPMTSRDTMWETTVPVDHPDVPILYFVQAENPGLPGPRFSPMRICYPRRLGIEEPTRIFWPFLEGFEEGLAGWQLLSKGGQLPPLSLSPMAKNGHAALLVSIPAGKRSATLASTRVRGWQVSQHNATGLSVWLRALDGPGQARFTLFSQAYSTNQVMALCSHEVSLNDTWQRVNLPFEDFPGVVLSTLDLFTIEFVANGPSRFLIDDLQLLGWWPLQ
jgi:hypothetical protein